MITLVVSLLVMLPFYVVYLALRIAFFPIFWLFEKPKEEKEEYWIIF